MFDPAEGRGRRLFRLRAGRPPRSGGAKIQTILLNIESPTGAHDFATVPSFFGQFITTGTEPGNVGAVGFPELRLDLFAASPPIVIYDGASTGSFAPSLLTLGGLNFGALTGLSLACQVIADGNTTTANAIFAVSNVLVLDL